MNDEAYGSCCGNTWDRSENKNPGETPLTLKMLQASGMSLMVIFRRTMAELYDSMPARPVLCTSMK